MPLCMWCHPYVRRRTLFHSMRVLRTQCALWFCAHVVSLCCPWFCAHVVSPCCPWSQVGGRTVFWFNLPLPATPGIDRKGSGGGTLQLPPTPGSKGTATTTAGGAASAFPLLRPDPCPSPSARAVAPSRLANTYVESVEASSTLISSASASVQPRPEASYSVFNGGSAVMGGGGGGGVGGGVGGGSRDMFLNITAPSPRSEQAQATLVRSLSPSPTASHGAMSRAHTRTRTLSSQRSVADDRTATPPHRVLSRSLGLHVLLVDDEALNRRLGQRMLERLGCSCVALDDGIDVAQALAHTLQLPDGVSRGESGVDVWGVVVRVLGSVVAAVRRKRQAFRNRRWEGGQMVHSRDGGRGLLCGSGGGHCRRGGAVYWGRRGCAMGWDWCGRRLRVWLPGVVGLATDFWPCRRRHVAMTRTGSCSCRCGRDAAVCLRLPLPSPRVPRCALQGYLETVRLILAQCGGLVPVRQRRRHRSRST